VHCLLHCNDEEKVSVHNLKITGTMDARDFKTMRDEMPSLERIDLSLVTIAAYKGTIGTKFQFANYSANEIPPYSGFNSSKNEGNSTYLAIKLPETLISIDSMAFANCTNMKSINRPSTITEISANCFENYDGTIYHSIILDSQKWLVENLRTNNYNNGDSIYTTETPSKDISNQVDPFYQWSVNGDSDNDYILGKLYTWNAATDNRGVCPEGFRVPSKEDWDRLTNYLSEKVETNNTIAKQMASSTNYWNTSSTADVIGNEKSSNNSSGFSALPVGVRLAIGNSSDLKKSSWWWSTSEYDDEAYNGIWAFGLNYYEPNLVSQKLRYRNFGLAVRSVSETRRIAD